MPDAVLVVPPEIEHALIWTCLPVIPPDLPPSIAPRVLQDGLWGFTGSNLPPPSPSTLHECLPALSDWNVTADKLIRSPQGTPEEDELVRQTSSEIDAFVRRRWVESEWETAWFVNPPVRFTVDRHGCTLLIYSGFSGCKVYQAWPTFMSLLDINHLKRRAEVTDTNSARCCNPYVPSIIEECSAFGT